MKYDLYADDLACNPRWTESSALVLKWWTQDADPYAETFPPDGATDKQRGQFASLTAERIFFRRKIIGLREGADVFADDKFAKNAYPFGKRSPALADLLSSKVTAVMTLVPLAPLVAGCPASLARLYCVSGLEKDFDLPFDGDGPNVEGCFNWFVGGVESENCMKPTGNSWHLAAHLLARAVNEGLWATEEIRRRLATGYAVTGTVTPEGRVCAVEGMAEKIAQSRIPEFGSLTWIVPEENADNAVCASGKVAPVSTVDDACAHVRALGAETSALMSLVQDGVSAKDVQRIRAHMRKGADANALSPDGRNARQMIMSNILRKIVGLVRTEGLKDKSTIEIQNAVQEALAPEWDAEKASSYYGNAPLLFFLAARSGDAAIMRHLRAKMDIDAVDRDGETALDFAIETGDKTVEKRLRRAGAKRRGIYALGSKSVRAFLRNPEDACGPGGGKFIAEALENGLDPLAETGFGLDEKMRPVEKRRWMWDNDKAAEDPWDKSPLSDEVYSTTSVLKEAILAKNRELVAKCLEAIKRRGARIPESYLAPAEKRSSPMIIKSLRRFNKKGA